MNSAKVPHPTTGTYVVLNFTQQVPYRSSEGWLYFALFGKRKLGSMWEQGAMVWRWRLGVVEDVSPLLHGALPSARGNAYPDTHPQINCMCMMANQGNNDTDGCDVYWLPMPNCRV